MNNKTDKIKSIISEAKALDRFLMSRGIDPRFVTTDQKVSHAKSGEFQKWLRDRQFREQDELEDELIEQKTSQEKFKSGLKKAGYDPDKGAKRLTDVIAKQKKEREEHEKKYGHLYAKEEVKSDYDKVKGQTSNMYNKDVKLNGYVTMVGKQPKGEYERKVDKYLKKKYNKEEVESVEENHIAIAMGKEMDDEGSMTLNQLDQMSRGIDMVRNYVGKDMKKQLPSWVQSKITLATDYIDTVGNYLSTTNEEVEIDEVAKWRSTSVAKKVTDPDDESSRSYDYHHENPRSTGMKQATSDKPYSSGSLMTRPKAQVASQGARKGMITKQHAASLKDRIKSDMRKEEVEEPTSELEEACWTGYSAVGTKMKNGKKVPNCVPTKESFEDEHGIGDKKKQNSKSARIIKSIYKKKNMKEDIYDHEKDDKSTVVYGKKPKISNIDDKASMGENKPEASAVMSGGTTLTGQNRDVVEIDPMMRKRPGQPDPTKK